MGIRELVFVVVHKDRGHAHWRSWWDLPILVFDNTIWCHSLQSRRGPISQSQTFKDDGREIGQLLQLLELGWLVAPFISHLRAKCAVSQFVSVIVCNRSLQHIMRCYLYVSASFKSFIGAPSKQSRIWQALLRVASDCAPSRANRGAFGSTVASQWNTPDPQHAAVLDPTLPLPSPVLNQRNIEILAMNETDQTFRITKAGSVRRN